MKIALLCDTHFGVRSDSKIFLEHQRAFFQDIFFPELQKKGIKTVLHLGDIFDRRKQINFYTLAKCKEFFFDPLKKNEITMHAILGNHDTFFTTTNEINSVDLLLSKEYQNIHVYEHEPVELEFGHTKILMCPWLSKDIFANSMQKISKSNANILMGHFDIKGFEMMKGIVSDHGIDHKEFRNFESVYSGHYHYPSAYGNIRYLGSQYEMNWSDYGARLGFYILDTITRELEFVENNNKIHHKLEYDDTDLTIDEIASFDMSVLKDCLVRVVVRSRNNMQLFDMFRSRLNDSGAADVKIVENSLNLPEDGIEDYQEGENTQKIMHKYIDAVETTVKKDEIKTFVDLLYHEAISKGGSI